MKKIIITTSWDDGQKEDLRLLKLLNKYGIKATFYVPFNFKNRATLNKKNIKYLMDNGAEIGGHTINHIPLAQLSEEHILKEIIDGKKKLEYLIGKKITSFSYPNGKFNYKIIDLVKKAGYKLARTTVAFNTSLNFDPFSLPVSLQFFTHNRLTNIKHAFKEGNIHGLINYLTKYKITNDLFLLNQLVLKEILKNGGIMHIWGHSWEIEKYSLWGLLEKTLKLISNKKGVKYLTNGQLME